MARFGNSQMQRIRTDTRKQTPRHELRVVRNVAPGQTALSSVLDILRDTTGNFVDYKKDDKEKGGHGHRPDAKLGVTLLMLGPLMRHVFGIGPGQRVPVETLRSVETDLNARMAHAKFQDYSIPLQDQLVNPLGLFGAEDQYLGIVLDEDDLRLTGDRAIVEKYFRDKYQLSRRAMRRHLAELRPHVTIGEVRYDQMSEEEAAAIRENPSAFIIGAANYRQRRLAELEQGPAPLPVIFPETIMLNGLRIACQPKGS